MWKYFGTFINVLTVIMGSSIGLVLRSQLPNWFQPYAEMEAKAAYISTYQAQVVYGLLQTEEYAHAVLATGAPDEVHARVLDVLRKEGIL